MYGGYYQFIFNYNTRKALIIRVKYIYVGILGAGGEFKPFHLYEYWLLPLPF
jgi:hypothetical protein